MIFDLYIKSFFFVKPDFKTLKDLNEDANMSGNEVVTGILRKAIPKKLSGNFNIIYYFETGKLLPGIFIWQSDFIDHNSRQNAIYTYHNSIDTQNI